MNRFSELYYLVNGRTLLLLLGLLLNACGSQSNQSSGGIAEGELLGEQERRTIVAGILQESLEALADSNFTRATQSLRAAASSLKLEKKCQVNGEGAQQSFAIDREFQWEAETPRYLFLSQTQVLSDFTRSWSYEDGALACLSDQKNVAIDFESNLTSYQLQITSNKSETRILDRKTLSTQSSVRAELSRTSSGERQVKWLSQSVGSDGSLQREKSINMTIDREESFLNLNQAQAKLTVSIKSPEPLTVQTRWDKLSFARELLELSIQSGQLSAQQASGSKVVATFKDWQILLKSSCQFESGDIRFDFYAAGELSSKLSVKIQAKSGAISATQSKDGTETLLDDLEIYPCDQRDFQY